MLPFTMLVLGVDSRPSMLARGVRSPDRVVVSQGVMKRSLKGWQLLLLGVGTMVGAGVFVSTGAAAQDRAG